MSKRSVATAKAQYEHELSALEGSWEETTDLIKSIYVEGAEVGLKAADTVIFSEEAMLRVAKVLFAHSVSDGAGTSAPEIIDQCESAAKAIFATLKAVANE